MRGILKDLLGDALPDHLGLAHDRWAPLEPRTGKIPDRRRGAFLQKLAQWRAPSDYTSAYERWCDALRADGSATATVTLASRLLVGHGNPAPTDVGLTVHHTWSVPLIPGSALKGLLNHFIDVVYGPDELGTHPMAPSLDGEPRERARFRGVTWDEKRRAPLYGPGEVHRALFGAPATMTDAEFQGAGATIGGVVFHDALFVPGSAGDQPFAEDVLTVHQKAYYDDHGRRIGPSDYDDPNPVSFLTVKPGTQFLVALSGQPEWTAFALRELLDALAEWGIGGKTAAGYGRIVRERPPAPAAGKAAKVAPMPAEEFLAWLEQNEQRPQRELLEAFRREWMPRCEGLAASDRKAIGSRLKRAINSKKLIGDRDALLAEWLA
ncbi:hypothetical protein BE21_06040 [Sorangium cellulosum]|uniref:CRISPR type III-associated protein domain-containing protein n=1 Tax=Sorangium cellulosum TaxID=56 RepID=A0A150T9W2_SORCE|nr:hypothetical protein BE21_06040 [Sorangium cellulosum]